MGSVLGGTTRMGSCSEYGRIHSISYSQEKTSMQGDGSYGVTSNVRWKSGSIRLPWDRCGAFASLSWSKKNSSSDLTPDMVFLCLWLHFSVNIRFKTGDIKQQKPEIQVMFYCFCIAVSCSSPQKPCPQWIPVDLCPVQTDTEKPSLLPSLLMTINETV